MLDALWPYLVVVMAGALPNEIFRSAAVFLARGLSEDSELFRWIRIVAVALLAAVVSKIVVSPPAALATTPTWLTIAAVIVGVAAFLRIRHLFLSILVAEAAFVAAAWCIA